MIAKQDCNKILSWPFSRVVRVSVINQEQPHNHHSINFKLEVGDKEAPKYDVTFGVTKFCKLEKLKNSNSLENDTLFIKISVGEDWN